MIRSHIKNIFRDSEVNIDRSKYLRLDANERTIDFSQNQLLNLKKCITNNSIQSYPKDKKKVLELISRYEKINIKYISCFSGTGTALKYIFEALSYKENKILSFFPTYGMIEIYSKIYKLKITKILDREIQNSFKKKSIKNSAFIYFANPNQPSGTIIPYKKMVEFLRFSEKFKKIIIIDEAYIDFSRQKSLGIMVKKFNNLIVLKTLSKSIGIAGLRFSYMLANPSIANLINTYRSPYEISHFSLKAAEYFLSNPKILKNYLFEIKKSRDFVKKECEKYNYSLKETEANFFYIYFNKNKTFKIVNFLKKKKILVKHLANIDFFSNSIRVTYGSVKQMKLFFKVLKNSKLIK